MSAYVNKHTSAFWGRNFVRELEKAGDESQSSWLQVTSNPLPNRVDWRSYDGA